MTKHIFITFLLFLITENSHSQNDYLPYYQLINKVKIRQAAGQHDSLTLFLKQAFDLVAYVHVEDLRLGKRIAKQVGDNELLAYCELALREAKDNLDQSLQAKLDSAGKEDQRVRSRKYVKARDYCKRYQTDSSFNYQEKTLAKSKRLMEEWRRVDSGNVELIKQVISSHGFPSEKMVGAATNFMVSIILLHYDEDTANHVMGESLTVALREGAIRPRGYARIMDRHLLNAGKPQLFYSIPINWTGMTEEERMEYNRNRLSIGLNPLEEMNIVERRNGTVVVKH